MKPEPSIDKLMIKDGRLRRKELPINQKLSENISKSTSFLTLHKSKTEKNNNKKIKNVLPMLVHVASRCISLLKS